MHDHHVHQHLHEELEKRQQPNVVYQYVYKTADPTFDGPIAGYTTLNAPNSGSTPVAQANNNNNNNGNSNGNSNNNNQNSAQSQKQQQQQAAANQAAISSANAALAATQSSAQAAQTSAAQTKANTQAAVSSTAAASSSSPDPTTAANNDGALVNSPTSLSPVSSSASATSAPSAGGSNGGISGGAKAGIAIVVILAIAAVAAVAFLLLRRKKKQSAEEDLKAHNEKAAPMAAGAIARSHSTTSTRTTATAPRLSLRPVTQFLPDLASKAKAAQGPGGASLMGAAALAPANQQSEKSNPFGDHAATQSTRPMSEKDILPIQQNVPENPFGNHAATNASTAPGADAPAPLRVRTPSPETTAAVGAGVGALAGAGAVAAASRKDQKPRNLDHDQHERPVTPSMNSPIGSEFSAAPGTPNGGPSTNVHRVQLDFKPSMDDELELKAGALVRLLHEYDDGWALCIRLDRSQQGVAPRTCLSARPVKPRPPPNQARGPGPRPGPNGMPRPASPAMRGPPGPQRPSSPASGRGSPGPNGRLPRPMGPPNGPPRSMSPGPYGGGPPRSMSPGLYGGGPQNSRGPNGKRRSNSASDAQYRRQSPPGPSPMNPQMQRVPMTDNAIANHPDRPASPAHVGRKPVPGQAM